MSNPFKPSNSAVNKPKRNAYDLSHSNHITFNFGQLIPALCHEVLPGDTFKIDAALGLRFMPLAFPIQTKCRAHVHFFYQRTKNLWPGFLNFIYGNDKVAGNTEVPPFLDFNGNAQASLLQTCSLGDYLGLPTVRMSDFRTPQTQTFQFYRTGTEAPDELLSLPVNQIPFPSWPTEIGKFPNFNTLKPIIPGTSKDSDGTVYTDFSTTYCLFPFVGPTFAVNNTYNFVFDVPKASYVLNTSQPRFVIYNRGSNTPQFSGECSVEDAYFTRPNGESVPVYRFRGSYVHTTGTSYAGIVCLAVPVLNAIDAESNPVYGSLFLTSNVSMDAVNTSGGTPFQTGTLPVSSLPFRCYESIYNSFYRDDRNNPLTTSNGNPVYNKYLLNDSGGKDDTLYTIHNRNWEFDPYTSAVSSPQQGAAPLVGISSYGDVTFQHEGKEYTFSSETADDADTITKINVTENVPNAVARAIVNTVTSGISINDFRNVNAYQRWLETNIRRGLKYKDQTLARWGVTPADSTLDMPEFIGGFSVDVDVNTVTNTNGVDSSVPLGDYAANATAFGGSKHRISQYCDQHGFIMAIVSVIPTPVYTQLFPRMFSRFSALDYYSPEFSQIGLQAIRYGELCPLEVGSPQDPNHVDVNTTFGYQRPWHDYIFAPDEAHGLFRTDFNQFLLSRVFYNPPTLGPDFLTVSPGSLNDVFTVNNRNNILGMIHFKIEAHRPIPQVYLPSL